MKAKKQLTKTDDKVSVPPPSGYHWMEEKGRYFLMKGDYKPHSKAVEKAEFRVVTHG
jgi:hypothetical protein